MWFVWVKTAKFKFELFQSFFLFHIFIYISWNENQQLSNYLVYWISDSTFVSIVHLKCADRSQNKIDHYRKTKNFPSFWNLNEIEKKTIPLVSVGILFICLFVANETQSICQFTLEFINLIRVCILILVCVCAVCARSFSHFLLLPNFFYWSSLVPHHSQVRDVAFCCGCEIIIFKWINRVKERTVSELCCTLSLICVWCDAHLIPKRIGIFYNFKVVSAVLQSHWMCQLKCE